MWYNNDIMAGYGEKDSHKAIQETRDARGLSALSSFLSI